MQRLEGAIKLVMASEVATREFGEDLALALAYGDLVTLSGDLGTGKSTLARATIRNLCDDPQLEVPSPTFTLVQPYQTAGPWGVVSHYDLYRLNHGEELQELGLEEALDSGIVLLEWPERAAEYLPVDALKIVIEQQSEFSRLITVSGNDEIMTRLARSLTIRGFLRQNWQQNVSRKFLVGDASTRSYETSRHGGDTRILMNSLPMTDGPILAGGLPYSQIAQLAEDVRPFVAIAQLLQSRGFTVPQIYAADFEAGLLLTGHLGSNGIVDPDGKPNLEKYLAAAEALASLHDCQWPRVVELQDGHQHNIPAFDRPAMMIEVDLLIDWYAQRTTGNRLSQPLIDEYHAIWQQLIGHLARCENSLLLRDYHSPNILWQADRSGIARIGMIDFQDAVIGPSCYDIACLAQDARVDIDVEMEQKITTCYIELRQKTQADFDIDEFQKTYAIMAAQRVCKVLGIFVRLDIRDGKPAYLGHLPRLENYLQRSLAHPVLADLKSWLMTNTGLQQR